jgi:hypothetical protein
VIEGVVRPEYLRVSPGAPASVNARRNERSAASAGRTVFLVRRRVSGLATGIGTPAECIIAASREVSA